MIWLSKLDFVIGLICVNRMVVSVGVIVIVIVSDDIMVSRKVSVKGIKNEF